jgi:hypothetical protein
MHLLVWSSGMTSLSHREDPGFDPQHEHLFAHMSSYGSQHVTMDSATDTRRCLFARRLREEVRNQHAHASDKVKTR